jgi:hypothetical protein
MKDIIISWAICTLVLFTALFLGFAFAEWAIAPGTWTPEARGSCAALALVLELIVTLLFLFAANKSNAE